MSGRRWMAVAAGVCLLATAAVAEETTLTIGEHAPDFSLQDLQGRTQTLSQYRDKVVVLDFWSATCPVSARYEERLKTLTIAYAPKGVVTLGIDSNKTEDAPLIQRVAAERGVIFPILLDPGNVVADQYGGLTTPHVFVVNAEGQMVYQGAIDDEGLMGRGNVSRQHLREALDAVLAGQPIKTPETEPVGCSIKRVAR